MRVSLAVVRYGEGEGDDGRCVSVKSGWMVSDVPYMYVSFFIYALSFSLIDIGWD